MGSEYRKWKGRLAALPLAVFLGAVASAPASAQAVRQGVAACLPCHRETLQAYVRTAHFRTSQFASPNAIKGSFAEGKNVLRTRAGDIYFKMERRGDSFYQTGHEKGKQRTAKFDLVVGSGRKGQSYFYWRDGLLYQLPISYLSATGEWINSPGYPDGKVHFERVVPPRCLECYTSYFQLEISLTRMRYGGSYVLGVSCQSCHIEGSNHTNLRNPLRLSRDRRVDVCALCHSGLRDNRRLPFTYRPGENLSDYLTTEPAPSTPDVHGNQVGLMRRSACFRASPEMSCSTCHNVHKEERDLAPFAAKCLQCHEGAQCKLAGEIGARITEECISCHMPNQQSGIISFNTSQKPFFQFYRNHEIGIYRDVAKSVLARGLANSETGPAPRVQFVDVAPQANISFKHENGASGQKLMVETFGSGVACFDYDNDGWVDLFFANGANLARRTPSPGNALFRNLGKGKFADATQKAGIAGAGHFATGVAAGDYDNDGFQDLYVTGYGSNQLFRNNGDGTFTDVTSKARAGGGGWSSSAGFLDYDRDGDLDLFVVRYLDYDINNDPYCGHKKPGYRMYCDPRPFDGFPNLLYRNNGDGTFTEVGRASGIASAAGKGLGISVGDVDGDGWPDIYIANDGVRDFLYRNNGDGTFADVGYAAGVGFDMNGKPMAGMGTEIADYDGDELLDIFVTNFSEEYNTLYRNLGDLAFTDVTLKAGLESGLLPLGFGTKLFDFDNDRDLDIYVTNGHVTDNVELYQNYLSYKQTDLLYENNRGRFHDVSAASGPAFQAVHVGRGAAVCDFDNDGDLDMVVSNSGAAPMLFRNDGGNRNHWIVLVARGRESNRFGIGAKVRVTSGGRTQVKEITSVGSYLSSSDVRLHFGLGKEAKVSSVEIRWPSGRRQLLRDVAADQTLLLDEANAQER